MGTCCSCHDQQTAFNVNAEPSSPTSSSSCTIPDCSVISDLKEFCLLFKTPQTSTDEDINKIAASFEHYLVEHADYDTKRSKNICSDSECQYDKEYKSQFGLNNRQQLHGYFYHYHKYNELKKERQQSLHFLHVATSVCVQHNLQTLAKKEDEFTSILNNTTNRSIYTQTSSITPHLQCGRQPSCNLSIQISRLLSPLAPGGNSVTTPIIPEDGEAEEELSQSITNVPLTADAYAMTIREFCEEQTECDRLRVLLMFSQNVDPKYVDTQQDLYSNEFIERIQNYWDHYSEAHIEDYVERECMHNVEKKKDDEDDGFCEFLVQNNNNNLNNSKVVQLQLLLHQHFYHENIMKEENNRIKYVKETMHGQEIIDKFKPTLNTILSQANNLNMNNVLQFGFEWQTCAEMACFTNPKEEILKNKYVAVEKSAWNNLLKQINSPCGYLKLSKTKRSSFTMKELIALKLYTDFDELQRMYRRAYHAEEESERFAIQSQFYHWNNLLSSAVAKSNDIITQTLYHGIDCFVSVPTFCGKYHGPISCTKLFSVAKGFAGDRGSILEIYPSFGRKGIDVSWISRYPDEQEVLYFDSTFNIKEILSSAADATFHHQTSLKATITLRSLRDLQKNANFIGLSILKALQTINVESRILSFNDIKNDDSEFLEKEDEEIETFRGLNVSELMSIFYLLYIQYKPREWAKLVQSHDDVYTQVALAQYRDQFAQLTQNVSTIRMESAPQLIKYFFSVNLDDDDDIFDDDTNLKHVMHKINTGKYRDTTFDVRFETIIKLFPSCAQISIDGANFDWSLSDFVCFLKKYNLDFSDVQLQDIFIRFNLAQNNVAQNNRMAKKRLKHAAAKSKNNFVSELAKLGWRFVTASHLHRFGFEPQAEKPFLILFMNEGRVFVRSYTKRIMGNAPKLVRGTTNSLMSSSYAVSSSTTSDNNNIEGDHAIVDYNPKHLFLSKTMLAECHYRETLICLLRNRRNLIKNKQFDAICGSVETLILYPIDREICDIFCQWKFSVMREMFPNCSDIYLRETTFNQNLCLKLIKFIQETQTQTENEFKLKRIFYSVNQPCANRHVAKLKLRLNVIKWDFSVIEQVAFKIGY